MELLCGYRVIRDEGGGERSRVVLAHDSEDRVVVARVIEVAASDPQLEHLVKAMTAADHPHLLPLADVGVLDDGRTLLVTPRVAGGTLGELIARRGSLTPGESVGVLTAVAGAVRALHDAGWSHGRLIEASVLLTSDGIPVLAGFGDAHPLGSGADAEGSLAEDVVALGGLCRRLLERAPRSERVLQRLDAATTLDAIEWAVAEAGDPLPLSMDARAMPEEPDRSTRADPFGFLRTPTPSPEPRREGLIDRFLDIEGLGVLMRPLLESMRAVRRRVWLAAGGVAVALVVALVLVPAASPDGGGDSSASAAERGGRSESDSEPGAGSPETMSSPTPLPSEAGTVSQEMASGEAETEAAGDDPLQATRTLLRTRELCFETATSGSGGDCLSRVDSPGSAALADDTATLESIAAGGPHPAPITIGDAPLVQQTGDSAIIAAEAVSILVVRGENGWRIRDTFDGAVG